MNSIIKIKKLITFILSGCLLVSFCSCEIRTAKFDFDVENGVIVPNYDGTREYAQLTVTTTCTSGIYYFKSTSQRKDGGWPTIVLEDGTEITATGFPTTGMEEAVYVRRGNVIERTWEFYLPDGFEPGEYTVKVSWNKSVETFENVSFTREP